MTDEPEGVSTLDDEILDQLEQLDIYVPTFEDQNFKSSLIDVDTGWYAAEQEFGSVIEQLLEKIRDLKNELGQ